MGNCSQCFREGLPQKPKNTSVNSTHASTLLDDGSQPRYTKMTLDQLYQDGLDDLNGLQNIDSDTIMNFTKEEIFLQGDIDEDTQKRRRDNYKRNKNLESIQQTTNTDAQGFDQFLKAPQHSYDFTESHGVNWKTNKFRVDQDNIDIELNNHFRYECNFKDIWSKSLIIEFYLTKCPYKPFAFVAIDFLALAIGPKSCDLEVRDYKSRKYLGRIAFDISIKQLQQIELSLFDLKCKINHKEEKAIYSQFKFISSSDGPKVSGPTYSQIGRFKKEKNYTRFRWIMNEDQQGDLPMIKQIVSLESLKNSSLQLVLKVDRNFSEAMHKQVVKKINLVQQYKHVQEEKKDQPHITPQIFVESVENSSNLISLAMKEGNDLLQISRDSHRSQNINQSLLNGEQKHLIKQHLSFFDAKHHNAIKHHSQAVDDFGKKLTELDMLQLYNSPQFNQQLEESQDPLDILSRMQIVKRSKSIMQKRGNRKTIVIDAADYYSKYNEVGDGSHSLITSFIGECYLGITKLLQCEYRQFDRRDSNILRNKLNNSIKMSNQDSASFRDSKLEQIVANDDDNSRKHNFQLSKQRGKNNDKKYFSEQLWIMGKVIGTLSGTFKVNNLPLIQQMTLGILTENGIIMNQAPILIEERDGLPLGTLKRKLRNERITKLIELTKKLKKIDSLKGKKEIYHSYNEKEKILNDLIQILCESDKTVQGHMYKYFDDFDLIRAQQAFVELAFHCLLLVESVRYEFKRDYYEIISQILMRDELKLANVTLKGANVITSNAIDNTRKLNRLLDDPNYDKSLQMYPRQDSSLNIKNSRVTPSVRAPLAHARMQQQKMNQGISEMSVKSMMTNVGGERYDEDTKDRLRNEKLKMAIFYQKLLYQTLEDCLNKFCRKDVEPYLKSYLEICMSLCFFRVPTFQKLFINCITEKTQMKIEEWKGTSWNIDEQMDLDIEEGIITLYDWDSNFHSLIPLSQDSQQLLLRIQANKKWQIRIKKRSIALFHIVKRWANILISTVQSQNLFWEDIPGYSIILKQMLVQLKERNVADYADSLIDTIASLLPNTQLLTIFINIIFGKTNAYDSKTLCITMDIATKWINYVEQSGYEFPSNFDFQFFLKGIQVALDMDHSISTPRTLYLIYRILHFLPLNQRAKIITMLFSKYFYTLMFSWSYTIRDIFISLMLYQIEFFYIDKFSSQLVNQQSRQFKSLAAVDPVTLLMSDQEKDKTQTNMDSIKQQRKQHIKNMDEKMKVFEQLCHENPTDALMIFEQQLQPRRQRLISEAEQFRSITLNKFNSDLPRLEKQTSESQQAINEDTKSQLLNKDSTLTQFLKTHSIFRQKMLEIETIEDYLSMKKNEKAVFLLKQSSSQHASSPSLMEQQSTEVKSVDIEASYQKIVQNVPQHTRVYISSAIEEFYRQIEEYELWKSGQVSYFSDVLSVLPEFNMEKNMPVEDDENLDKQEEW